LPDGRALYHDYNNRIMGAKVDEEEKTIFDSKIILEVGHGGHEFGADSFHLLGEEKEKVTEYELNLIVADEASSRLEELGFNDVVIFDGMNKSLYEMGAVLAQLSDIVISIHHNAFHQEAQGTEVIYANEASETFASYLSQKIASSLNIKDRGAKKRNLAILRGATDVDPDSLAVLTEGYFMTSQTVEDHISWSKSYGIAIAEAMRELSGS